MTDHIKTILRHIEDYITELETDLHTSGYPAASMTNSGARHTTPGPRDPCHISELDYLTDTVDCINDGWRNIVADHLHATRPADETRLDKLNWIRAHLDQYAEAGGDTDQLHTDYQDMADTLATRLKIKHGHTPGVLPPFATADTIARAYGIKPGTVRVWATRGKVLPAYTAGGVTHYAVPPELRTGPQA